MVGCHSLYVSGWGSQLHEVSVAGPPCTLIAIQAYVVHPFSENNLEDKHPWLYFTSMFCHTVKPAHTEPYGLKVVTANWCQYRLHYVPVSVRSVPLSVH